MKPDEKELNPYQKSLLPFDPIVLVRDALGMWLLAVVAALVVGIGAYIYTDSGYVPQYAAGATLVLTNRDSGSTVYDNLGSASSMATVFSEVLNSSVMRNNILKELDMDAFDGTIQASEISSTNLLTLRVTAGDPRTAFRVIKVLLEQHDMVTYAVMGNVIIEVLEPPVVPTSPINQVNPVRAFRTAFVMAGAVVFAMLIVLSYFKDVVRSKEEADAKLSCWCLGEIGHERKNRTVKDFLRRKRRGILISDPQTGFQYVTTMNKLAHQVEKKMGKGKILMATSVIENEGKSTVAANLALALARKYPRVLLVDCDLRKPACRVLLEQEMPRSFIQNVLSGDTALEDAVCFDKRTRLHMLFAKRTRADEAGNLVNSQAMAALLERAREQFDYVIIDLPPMSVAPDAEALTEFADAAMLVVRQNGVYATDLNRAIGDLQRGGAKLLGCVINNVYTTQILSGEGYGTGYGRYGGYYRYSRYGKYGKYAAGVRPHTDE